MRRGEVFYQNILAGNVEERDEGYFFTYNENYISQPDAKPVSLTFPLREEPYNSSTLFSFFDGLIPEGWLLEIAEENWKLDSRDRMGLLLSCCRDCIGAVHIIDISD